jgi:hypothetical protein
MTELPTERDFEDCAAWTGRDVLAPGGERLGAVEMIFLDEETDRPEWVLVRLDDAERATFVPLAGATVEERSIRVEHDRARVAAAPTIDVEETLTVDEERRLYDHYGLSYSRDESSTVLPETGGTETQAPAGPGAGSEAREPEAEEPRPRLRRFSPTSPAPSGEPDRQQAGENDAPSTPEPASAPETVGTGATDAGDVPPVPIPEPAPQVIPPSGGYQGEQTGDGASGGPLGVLKRRPAIPVAIAAAIAGLIAVLALRRRR